jgi:hypothetical protein
MKPPEGSITPQMVEADGKLRLSFGEEILVLPRGLQPSLLRTKSGALIVHAQSRYIMVSQPAGKRFFRLKAP